MNIIQDNSEKQLWPHRKVKVVKANYFVDSLPIVEAVELIPPMTRFKYSNNTVGCSTGWTVKIRCPFCGKYHWHGWAGPGEEVIRSRKSHCSPAGIYDASYVIYLKGER